ncbi:uncharacterized protein LOC129289186 [Prosopis cineraria]|uniref:uncharacterized protein LOC129289186 n=1 Tax=Prosopis cineraria TaxID=364024 RepID=UPI00240EEC0A|nr:uncharacterized protein LOC129289186 [Prosopis cineraria]
MENEGCKMDRELLIDLIKLFKVVSFHHLTRDKNCFADALATLAAMIQLDCGVHVQPIQVEARSFPTYCLNVEEGQEEYPWFQDIKDYITKRSYPTGMIENEKKTLHRLAMTFFISKDVLYKRGYDGTLLRCKILPNQEDNRGKWAPTYEGPYVVKHAFSGGALILADMDGQELAKPINVDAVKRYFA